MKTRLSAFRITVLLAAAVLLFCACSSQQPTWQEQYDLGQSCLSDKDPEKAVDAFSAAIKLDAQNAQGFIGRGDAYVMWGESLGADSEEGLGYYQLAADDYSAALELLGGDAAVQKKLDDIAEISFVHSDHEHDWVGATFKEPGVCSVCGLTGEPVADYFAQNDADVLQDCPKDVSFTYVIYDGSDSKNFRIRDDGVLTVTENSIEPADEEGYSVVTLTVQMDVETTYEKATDIEMSSLELNFSIGDLYTGLSFPDENQLGVSGYDGSCQLTLDGETYDVAYTISADGEWDKWVADDDENETCAGQITWTVTVKIPDEYDGLVACVQGYEALPEEQSAAAAETAAESLLLDMSSGHCLKGSVFFRFGPPTAVKAA